MSFSSGGGGCNCHCGGGSGSSGGGCSSCGDCGSTGNDCGSCGNCSGNNNCDCSCNNSGGGNNTQSNNDWFCWRFFCNNVDIPIPISSGNYQPRAPKDQQMSMGTRTDSYKNLRDPNKAYETSERKLDLKQVENKSNEQSPSPSASASTSDQNPFESKSTQPVEQQPVEYENKVNEQNPFEHSVISTDQNPFENKATEPAVEQKEVEPNPFDKPVVISTAIMPSAPEESEVVRRLSA